MFKSPFTHSPVDQVNLESIDEYEVIVVSDMFVDDYVGGAELTTQALIDASPFKVAKIHSRNLDLSILEKAVDKYWVFGNFSNLDIFCS